MASDDLVALTTSQWSVMASDDLRGLTTVQWGVVATDDLVALTTGQWSVMASDDLRGLTTVQWGVVATDDLVALTTGQWSVMASDDLVELTTGQWSSMAGDDLRGLTTSQWSSLAGEYSANQFVSIFTSQWGQMATDDIASIMRKTNGAVSPLVLDLQYDGFALLPLEKGVVFDIAGTGSPMQTGWVTAEDGLLVRDLNGNGRIDSGRELFGDATILKDGTRASNGFDALSDLDDNSDGIIDERDSIWDGLFVWRDLDTDGLSQPHELEPIAGYDIVAINISANEVSWWQSGHEVRLQSAYTDQAGRQGVVIDVWFEVAPLGFIDPLKP
jgi:hypothetical protein